MSGGCDYAYRLAPCSEDADGRVGLWCISDPKMRSIFRDIADHLAGAHKFEGHVDLGISQAEIVEHDTDEFIKEPLRRSYSNLATLQSIEFFQLGQQRFLADNMLSVTL